MEKYLTKQITWDINKTIYQTKLIPFPMPLWQKENRIRREFSLAVTIHSMSVNNDQLAGNLNAIQISEDENIKCLELHINDESK